MAQKNQYNAKTALYPISKETLKEMGLPVNDEHKICGIMLSGSLIERGYHRWLNNPERDHPIYGATVEPEIAKLTVRIKEAEAAAAAARELTNEALAAKRTAEAEAQTQRETTHQHVQDKQELQQQVAEAQALQKEAEEQKAVSDNLITARETERDGIAKERDTLQRVVDRYSEKYQDVDREFNAWQRFGAWFCLLYTSPSPRDS